MSLIWIVPSFAAGILTGLHVRRKNVAHQRWMAKHLAAIDHTVTATPADPHPQVSEDEQ